MEEDRQVSKEELKAAYDELGTYVNGVLTDQPVSAADDQGEPKVGSLITTVLIGLGVAHLIKR